MMHVRTVALAVALLVSVCTCQLRFVAIGDWGGHYGSPYTTDLQINVANQLDSMYSDRNLSFVVGLGDNFYWSGVSSVDDIQFKKTFEDVYASPMTWFQIAGNHDHMSNVSAQIAYSDRSDRWHFESMWYTTSHNIPNSNQTLQIFHTDTTVIVHGGWQAKEQLDWLENELKMSNASWKIVVGHHPILSVAYHGPTPALQHRFSPLLEQYGVAAYLAGHEHALQHFLDGSMSYFVSGCGAHAHNHRKHDDAVPVGSLKYFSTDIAGGFLEVQLSPTNMETRFINSEGTVLYEYTIPKPTTQAIAPQKVPNNVEL